MIIYFTGTGNSRYIAELMAEVLNDDIRDAARLIKTGEIPCFASDVPYVFVAPTYAWRLPRVFAEWIEKCKFEGSRKAYFVLTCGAEIGAADSYAQKLAAKCGFEHMGTAELVMPENYIAMFTPTAEDEDAEIFKAAREHIAKLCDNIVAGTAFEKVKISLLGRLESGIVNCSFYTFYIGAKKFYATDECVSCGKCVENCMLNNITLKGGKPLWGKNCTHCMACICKCPTEAIEYGKKTKGRRRYVCREEKKKQ